MNARRLKYISFCLFGLLLIQTESNAGGIDDQPFHFEQRRFLPDYTGRALCFGYFPFNPDPLNKYLNAETSSHDNFRKFYAGLALDNISNNGKHLDFITSFHYVLPRKIKSGYSDSLVLKFSGWHSVMSVGWDFVKGNTVTIAVGPAITYGNLKIRRYVNGEKTKYKNPFIAPGMRAEFRITIRNIMIGARTVYGYDFTHALWKRKDDMMPELPGHRNSGLAYFGYVGLIF